MIEPDVIEPDADADMVEPDMNEPDVIEPDADDDMVEPDLGDPDLCDRGAFEGDFNAGDALSDLAGYTSVTGSVTLQGQARSERAALPGARRWQPVHPLP
jgi:hypothetical protein